MAMQFNATFRRLAILVTLVLGTTVILLYQSSFPLHSHAVPQYVAGGIHNSEQKVSRDYSIKPIVYIFPQYYVFEDNNRLHGENFTEWVNVKKVTKNAFGLETIRPHESIGFYNGLEFATRKRQGDFLRKSGFYGAVFHHYWFAGRPVMEHVIQAMLEDGEPNIPFMLSWANEPWSARWDGGNDGKVLIAQDYGLQQAWRKHFDWLLPFFKHPQYIRSEGKVQFAVYNPTHMGHLAPQMFAAWRQWAVEEGLGGMDIIETRWGEGSSQGPPSWEAHPPDAINEFQPHAGGRDWSKFSSVKRLSRVYHRGTLACWDTTPRHPTDGRAVCLPACHPKTWGNHLVEMFRKIKSDPNPIGVENFFFVNALNEWGEGNSIEPSAQFGDGYGRAMKEAMEITEKEHVWPDISTEDRWVRDADIKAVMNTTADVCVLVRASPKNADDKVFTLPAMLRSLQAQDNINWRAVVYQSERSDFGTLDQLILQALDPRVRRIVVPENVTTPKGEALDFRATDWLVKNLTGSDPGCASARYLLVTEASNSYEKIAFDAVLNAKYDLLGLNVDSRENIWNHPQLTNDSWADRCVRLENPDLSLCSATTPTNENFDLSATFFDFQRFRQEGHTFSTFTKSFPGREAVKMVEHLTSARVWTFSNPSTKACQVRHNPAYSSCLKTGNFWFDSPIFNEMGCYTQTDFIDILGKKSPALRDIDLHFFQKHGSCMRYKEEMYWNATHPAPSAKPTPSPTPVADYSKSVEPSADLSTTTAIVASESTTSQLTTSLSTAASQSVSPKASSSQSSSSQLSSSSSASLQPTATVESKKENLNMDLKQVVHA